MRLSLLVQVVGFPSALLAGASEEVFYSAASRFVSEGQKFENLLNYGPPPEAHDVIDKLEQLCKHAEKFSGASFLHWYGPKHRIGIDFEDWHRGFYWMSRITAPDVLTNKIGELFDSHELYPGKREIFRVPIDRSLRRVEDVLLPAGAFTIDVVKVLIRIHAFANHAACRVFALRSNLWDVERMLESLPSKACLKCFHNGNEFAKAVFLLTSSVCHLALLQSHEHLRGHTEELVQEIQETISSIPSLLDDFYQVARSTADLMATEGSSWPMLETRNFLMKPKFVISHCIPTALAHLEAMSETARPETIQLKFSLIGLAKHLVRHPLWQMPGTYFESFGFSTDLYDPLCYNQEEQMLMSAYCVQEHYKWSRNPALLSKAGQVYNYLIHRADGIFATGRKVTAEMEELLKRANTLSDCIPEDQHTDYLKIAVEHFIQLRDGKAVPGEFYSSYARKELDKNLEMLSMPETFAHKIWIPALVASEFPKGHDVQVQTASDDKDYLTSLSSSLVDSVVACLDNLSVVIKLQYRIPSDQQFADKLCQAYELIVQAESAISYVMESYLNLPKQPIGLFNYLEIWPVALECMIVIEQLENLLGNVMQIPYKRLPRNSHIKTISASS